MMGLGSVIGTSPLTINDFLHSKGTRNTLGYANPTVDRYLDQAKAAIDPEDQIAAYKKAATEFVKDPGFLVYRYLSFITVATESVHGLPNIEETWLDQS